MGGEGGRETESDRNRETEKQRMYVTIIRKKVGFKRVLEKHRKSWREEGKDRNNININFMYEIIKIIKNIAKLEKYKNYV